MRSKSLSYMPALDGIRAVAVLMVFAVHAFPEQTFPGGLGVDVFFLISGFLITRILLREHAKTGTIRLKEFYVKRLLRLWPPLIAMVVVMAGLVIALGESAVNTSVRSALALFYTSNIVMTVTELSMGHLAHTWSLAMEEQFYLWWPLVLVLMLGRRLSHRTIAIILATAVAACLVGWVLTADSAPFSPITKAAGLLAGCLTAILVARRPWQNTPAAFAAVGVFIAAFAAETMGVIGRDWSMVIVTLALPFLVLHIAFGQSIIVRALSVRWLVYGGVISYAAYLWHYPVLQVLAGTELPQVAAALIGLIATVGLAALSMKFVEGPALRLKDRVGSGSSQVRESVPDDTAITNGPRRGTSEWSAIPRR